VDRIRSNLENHTAITTALKVCFRFR